MSDSAGHKVTSHKFVPIRPGKINQNSHCAYCDEPYKLHKRRDESAHRSAPPEKCCDSQVPHGHAVGPPRAAAPDNAHEAADPFAACLKYATLAQDLREALHAIMDGYEVEDDCACDRCEATPRVKALLACADEILGSGKMEA